MACDYWSSDRRRKGIHPQRARSKKESENNMEIDFSNLTAEELTDFHCLKTFYSGVEAMDKFIQGDFHLSIENHYCTAYGVWHEKRLGFIRNADLQPMR